MPLSSNAGMSCRSGRRRSGNHTNLIGEDFLSIENHLKGTTLSFLKNVMSEGFSWACLDSERAVEKECKKEAAFVLFYEDGSVFFRFCADKFSRIPAAKRGEIWVQLWTSHFRRVTQMALHCNCRTEAGEPLVLPSLDEMLEPELIDCEAEMDSSPPPTPLPILPNMEIPEVWEELRKRFAKSSI